MSLIFERIQTDGIAQLSYLVGDDSEGVAAVFDPRPDVDCYLQLALEKQVSITHKHTSMPISSVARANFVRVPSQRKYSSVTKGARDTASTTKRS